MPFFRELKRRNVFRVGIAYVVSAWLLLQIADIVFEGIEAPGWVMKALMFLLALGFPLALAFSWAYEITPEGIRREGEIDRSRSVTHVTARRLDFVIIALLVLALGAFAWDRLYFTPTAAPEIPGSLAETAALPEGARESESTPGRSGTQAAGSTGTSIAVLPFVNLSADEEQEYFSDGISEELLNVLAKYPDLRVAARTSSFQFKGENRDITDIARQLNVNHVLEGSVRKSGTRLRITAQLIDATSGFHLWSETYDRELDDIFAIQDEISAAIGDALRVELALAGHAPGPTPRVAHSDNTAAYEAFLQGRHLINQRGNRNIRTAVGHLERCVRLDPDFAPCHAWLAIGHSLLLSSPGTYGDRTLAEVRSLAVPEYDKALELDPNLAEAHGAVALLAINTNEYELALERTATALELNPVYVDALNWRQIAAGALGQYTESSRTVERILEIDPLSIIGRLNFVSQMASADPERARRYATSLLDDGHLWAGYASLSLLEMFPHGNLSSSLEWGLKAYQIEPNDEFVNQGLMLVLALVGEADEARRISGKNHFLVYFMEGRYEDAVADLTSTFALDSENPLHRANLADALAMARQCEKAMPLYDSLIEESPIDLVTEPFSGNASSQLRMVNCLRTLGQHERAQKALERFTDDFEQRRATGLLSPGDHFAHAMARAIDGDPDAVVDALKSAMAKGFRRVSLFSEPTFQAFAEHPGIQALQAEMTAMLEAERAETLQLICHDNPAHDTWQPRRETCENVPEPQ